MKQENITISKICLFLENITGSYMYDSNYYIVLKHMMLDNIEEQLSGMDSVSMTFSFFSNNFFDAFIDLSQLKKLKYDYLGLVDDN